MVNPSWSKGYARKGAALHGARRYDEAIAAYEEGLKLEDSPALRKGLKEVQDAQGMLVIMPANFQLMPYQLRTRTRGSSAGSQRCSPTRICLENSPQIHGRKSISPTPRSCRRHGSLLSVLRNPDQFSAAEHDPKKSGAGRLVRTKMLLASSVPLTRLQRDARSSDDRRYRRPHGYRYARF